MLSTLGKLLFFVLGCRPRRVPGWSSPGTGRLNRTRSRGNSCTLNRRLSFIGGYIGLLVMQIDI